MADQLFLCRHAAGPAFAMVVEAELIRGGRVDAAETDSGAADLNLVTVANFRNSADVGRVCNCGQQQREGEDKRPEHDGVPAQNRAKQARGLC